MTIDRNNEGKSYVLSIVLKLSALTSELIDDRSNESTDKREGCVIGRREPVERISTLLN